MFGFSKTSSGGRNPVPPSRTFQPDSRWSSTGRVRVGWISLFILFFVWVPSGWADKWEDLHASIQEINQKLQDIKVRMDGLDTTVGNQADMKADLDALEAGINQISGKMDEFGFSVSKLSKRIDSLEASVNQLETGIKTQTPEAQATPVPSSSIQEETLAYLVREVEKLSARVEEMKKASPALAKAVPKEKQKPQKTGEPAPSGAEPASEKQGPDTTYQEAFTLYLKKDFDGAIGKFKEYLANYPDTELSDNCQYWIGMSFFGKGDYEGAVREMDLLVSQFPNSFKVRLAMLKSAEANIKLNRTDAGKGLLQNIIASAPDSDEAQSAQKMLNDLESQNPKE